MWRAEGFRRGLAAIAVTLLTLGAVTAAALASDGHARAGGAKVAFVRIPQKAPATVWVGPAGGGSAKELGQGDTALISPSGAYVAAAQFGVKGAALELYSTSGGAAHPFFDISQVQAQPLAWAPGSRYLAVLLSGQSSNTLAVIDTRTMRSATIARGAIDGASFAPSRSTRIAYAVAPSQQLSSAVNIHVAGPTGSGNHALTHDGHSLYPVWGAKGIAFDREQLRGRDKAPEYQLWLMSGSHVRRLTNLKVPALLDGLMPVAFSANGERLLAQYVGEDTAVAWTVTLKPLRARELHVKGSKLPASGYGISRDGRTLLVAPGGYPPAPGSGEVETVPFGGGRAHSLYQGVFASWNR